MVVLFFSLDTCLFALLIYTFAGLAVVLLLTRYILFCLYFSCVVLCFLVLDNSCTSGIAVLGLLRLRAIHVLLAFELIIVVSEKGDFRNRYITVEEEIPQSDLVVERQRAILTSFAIAVKALFYHVDLSIARHISMIVLGSLSTSLSTILPMLAWFILFVLFFVFLWCWLTLLGTFGSSIVFSWSLLFGAFLHLLPGHYPQEVRQLVWFAARWINALVERVLMLLVLLLLRILLLVSVRAEDHLELLRQAHVVPLLQG